jgi:hypothetical protein
MARPKPSEPPVRRSLKLAAELDRRVSTNRQEGESYNAAVARLLETALEPLIRVAGVELSNRVSPEPEPERAPAERRPEPELANAAAEKAAWIDRETLRLSQRMPSSIARREAAKAWDSR